MRDAAVDLAEGLRVCVVHHQPMPIIESKRIAAIGIQPSFGFRRSIVDLEACASSSPRLTEGSQGRTIRNKSIGTEMFFNSVGASFSKRASSALRIWRSTSFDTPIPP